MFFAGAFLALPMVAQNEPIRNPETDPKEIYIQDFESDWDTWSTAVVDTINGLDYFKVDAQSTSSLKIWEEKSYQTGFVHKDTVIQIFNGVKQTGSEKDIANNAFAGDSYTIRTDADDDITRQKALDVFGTNGGKKYFQYYAGDGSKVGNASGGLVPEYRRNLFIRLTPGAIEENSSYRITMYLKTTKLTNAEGEKNSTNATFRAEFMRGFFNSEKNFSMGRDVSSSNTFTFSKDDFVDGEWTKITYMSYFLTNEIAEQFCYYNGYYSDWGTAWRWKGPEVKAAGFDSLHIIRQPNKFFLRVSFRGDSTIYDLDNMSITKSTIGGIQHDGNLIRVDFGYQTNLKDQALAAKERTNIPAVELPGQFFTVRGLKGTKWQKIGISTAEYHDNGYLYMWAKPGAGGQPIKFENYDSVLVSFTNPTGVEYDTLSLKYNGTLYPNALDEAWVNAGKKVFDFTNEVSTPNPNISEGVYQMKNYPPVIRPNGAPYEDGAFGLDPNMSSIKLTLSRKIQYEENNTDGHGDKAFCQVYKNGQKFEVWPVTESADTYTIFSRPSTATPLSGDYTFKFVQLKGVGESKYGEDIVLNYNFGSFDKDLILQPVTSDWRSEITLGEAAWDRPVPESLYSWNNSDGFYQGNGGNFDPYKKNGLYKMVDDGIHGDCFFYLTAYKKGKIGKLYTVRNLKAGNYILKFPAFGWARNSLTTTVYVYAKPAGGMVYDALEGATKTTVGSIKPSYQKSWSGNADEHNWTSDVTGAEIYEMSFSVPTDGDYVLEWAVNHDGSQSYYGVAIGNFSLTGPSSLATKYVSKINTVLLDADAKKKEVDDATTRNYKGAYYNAFTAYIADVRANIFDNHNPSAYETAMKNLNNGITGMQERMDTVDLYYTAIDSVGKALTAKASYSGLEAYSKLNTIKTQFTSYDCSQFNNKQIADTVSFLYAAIENLDDRIAKNDGFAGLLDNAKKVYDSTYVLFKDPALGGKDFTEREGVNIAYTKGETKKATIGTMTDDEFFALYDEVKDSVNAYVFAMDGTVAKTRQIRELFALAESLGYEFGGQATKDSLKALIADLRKRDVALENVFRAAVSLQILKKFAAGETIDSLDVSALIPNYYLYSDGVADVNMEKKGDVWAVKNISKGNLTAIPGWSVSGIGGTNGYWLPTNQKVGEGDGHEWEDGHAIIGGLRCGPQTSGTIELADTLILPAGYYQFGLYGYNQTSNVALEFVSDSAKVGTGDKTSLNTVFGGGGKFNYKNAVKDSIKVSGKTTITIKQTSGSGSEFDMRYFILTLRGSLKVDYTKLAAAQEAKLADMITFVAPVAVAAEPIAVQYYNLNGVRVLAPEAGKVVIKRTILSNGKSVAEKILVK